jgi:hypothetical protein
VAGVVEQHPYGDLPAALPRDQVGQVAGHRRVELDGPALHLLEDRDGDERLGDAADPMAHLRVHRPAGLDVGHPGGPVPCAPPVAHLAVEAVHPGLVDRVERVLQRPPIEPRTGLGGGGPGRRQRARDQQHA